MIIESYKELWHFCTKRFKYLFLLALFLTPATMIDERFEKDFIQNSDTISFLLSGLMDLVQSVLTFMVLAYLYVHWHEHKKFKFSTFVNTSFKKLYPTISGYMWFVVFLLIPFVVMWLFSGYIAEFALIESKSIKSIHDYYMTASGAFNFITLIIMMIGAYFALKVMFVIYFSYKTGDSVGLVALRKCMKIRLSEIIQFIIVIGIYTAIYSLLLYGLGVLLGASYSFLGANYQNLLMHANPLVDMLTLFLMTLLSIPFQVLYVAFAYHLYKEYT
ncbi:MAG: hypothetical protein RLN62_05675 [Rickettsiales bacterium]